MQQSNRHVQHAKTTSVLAIDVLQTSSFLGCVLSQASHIEFSAQQGDVKMIILERVGEATADEFPAREPPDLLGFRLRLAGDDCLFYGNLLKLSLREFDSLGDAIAYEFAAGGPTNLLLLGFRLACSGRLL